MAAANLDLPTIEKGATYRHRLIWKDALENPISLVGATARMSIKDTIDSIDTLLNLTTTNGRLQLGGLAGTIDIVILDTITQTLTGSGGVYDIEIVISTGDVVRLVRGLVMFSSEITKILSTEI